MRALDFTVQGLFSAAFAKSFWPHFVWNALTSTGLSPHQCRKIKRRFVAFYVYDMASATAHRYKLNVYKFHKNMTGRILATYEALQTLFQRHCDN